MACRHHGAVPGPLAARNTCRPGRAIGVGERTPSISYANCSLRTGFLRRLASGPRLNSAKTQLEATAHLYSPLMLEVYPVPTINTRATRHLQFGDRMTKPASMVSAQGPLRSASRTSGVHTVGQRSYGDMQLKCRWAGWPQHGQAEQR